MAHFARKSRTGQERPVRFVNDLPHLHDIHLPECPSIGNSFAIGPSKDWRTVRLRPEIIAVVEGLQARTGRNCSDVLTICEVLSALIIAGLPTVAAAPHGPFSR